MKSSDHEARVEWERGAQEAFIDQRYSRRHRIAFDGGAVVTGSSSVHSVPLPYSDASAVDPEEMLVAAVASCHMLWFLSLAARQGYCVERYRDHAVGTLAADADGRMAITVVTLRPSVSFSGGTAQPDAAAFDALHEGAHDACFIARSVRAEVRCEPRMVPTASP